MEEDDNPSATSHSKDSLSDDSYSSNLIDLRSRVKIHYSMSFVILNFLGECLCLTAADEVVCKRLKDLSKSDKYIFKIIDFNEPSNAGRIKLDVRPCSIFVPGAVYLN